MFNGNDEKGKVEISGSANDANREVAAPGALEMTGANSANVVIAGRSNISLDADNNVTLTHLDGYPSGEEISKCYTATSNKSELEISTAEGDVLGARFYAVNPATQPLSRIVVSKNSTLTLKEEVHELNGLPIVVETGSSLNYRGHTYGEGSYVIGSDGIMHLTGADSTENPSDFG